MTVLDPIVCYDSIQKQTVVPDREAEHISMLILIPKMHG